MRACSGVRVLDLADASGAACAAWLADLGAEIIRAGEPDERTDAAILTGTPRALSARGHDPETLLARFPSLIIAAIAPFGRGGPRAEWRSCDTVAQALGGMLWVNGHPGEAPLRGLGTPAYQSAGLHAAIGVLLALLARRHSGRGQIVDVSLQECAVASLEQVTGLFHERGEVAGRQGTLHWTGAFRVAQCRDAPVLLSHLGDWTALLEWLKSDSAAADLGQLRWQDSALRRRDAAHVFEVLSVWAARYDAAELVRQAQLRRLPFAQVWPLQRVVGHPQLWARGFFTRDATGSVSVNRPLARAFSGRRAGGEDSGTPPRRTAAPQPVPIGARSGALRGLRVLDFTWVVAGPVATRLLADHGADVIKIERLDSPRDGERRGGWFGNLNRGKRSLAVDLGTARGIELVRDLARRCDVVIDNFSPRVMANWGLDAASLQALDPRLIVVSLSGFGASGPYADAVSYGPTLQAQTGFTWHMRHDGGAPAGWGFSYSDVVSGTCAALAVLAALWERQATGLGRAIDLGQLEILASTIAPLLGDALRGRPTPDAFGNREPDAAVTTGVYRCRDDAEGRERWCAIGLRGEDERRRLAAAIAAPALRDAAALDESVARWARTQTAEAVMALVQDAGSAAGTVADARDLTADPQLLARGYFVTLPGGYRLDGVTTRLSATPGAVSAPGPLLGEHADEILRDLLQLEQGSIENLRADGVIGQR